ncbi:serine/threonine-protein kinase [Streptomyces niveus]|uniref:serine/threonine-protein kinase n=1 Tax=Streptomyces niveus TaxID=193462 RepID=UPI0036780B70
MARYRLDERIGRGGIGEVWRGYDLSLNRPVAVKILLDSVANDEIVGRFRREALIGARLQHPGITVVHDVGHHDGRLFIVMELLNGEDFAHVLVRSPGGLPLYEGVALALQVAEALAAAHESDVVHRDLKPGNLFLLSTGRVKICDFGIARSVDATAGLTLTGRIFGTPAYMAPEQWHGEHVDARCDLYALGCVLFALLTGAPPFGADDVLFYSLMRRHVEEPPPRLSDTVAGVPAGLESLLQGLLAKDPVDRPDSAGSVVAALRAVSAAEVKETRVMSPAAGVEGRPALVASLLREAVDAACSAKPDQLDTPFRTLIDSILLAARFDTTLCQELMELAEQWSWKHAQGGRSSACGEADGDRHESHPFCLHARVAAAVRSPAGPPQRATLRTSHGGTRQHREGHGAAEPATGRPAGTA